jgi:hypothetical protein
MTNSFKNGRSEGILRAEAMTEKAQAVVFRTRYPYHLQWLLNTSLTAEDG